MYPRTIFIFILLLSFETMIISSASMTEKDVTIPTITSTEANSSGNQYWCIARDDSSETELQAALDYACGIGKADCYDLQADGKCYDPNTVKHHASYAFNSYYQKNPVSESCDFGGTAVVTSIDPSSKTCHFPPTSTSMTILNVTNLNSSTIFGTRSSPETPTSCANTDVCHSMMFLISIISVAASLHFELLLLFYNTNCSP